jgi:restriction system protein
MSRQKNTPLDDFMTMTSKLPWWAGITLALVSYLVLHSYATQPLMAVTGPAQFGAAAAHSLYVTLAMFGQIILPLGFCGGALISGVNLAKQKKLYNDVTKRAGVAALNEMSWSDFERLVSEYYRRKGFKVTREGGNGPDGGIDLVLRQKSEVYLVQCKQWKTYKVGVQPVREFYGVMASRKVAGGYFVTSGEFTEEARRFVKGLNLDLIEGRDLRKMIDIAQAPVPLLVPPVPGTSDVAKAPAKTNSTPPVALPAVSPSPLCPVCNSEMARRVARHGNNAGKEFWGCTTYPKCKGTRTTEGAVAGKEPAIAIPELARATPVLEKKVCPQCGTELVLRKFMSGPRSGEAFHACLPCKKGWSLSQA